MRTILQASKIYTITLKFRIVAQSRKIPAVTCVRLIAQETSILAPWIVRYSTDIGK